MIDIEKLIEAEIKKEPDQYIDPKYRDYWRTSNFGRCYRMQYWYRQGVGVSNPIDIRALKIFRVGNMFHRDIQKLLAQDAIEIEFKSEEYHVLGHADHVGEDYVEDFKTIGDFQWKLMKNKNFDVIKDKEAYIYQLMAYCYFLNKDTGRLTFIHKDSYSIKTFDFKLSVWEPHVVRELDYLNNYWDLKELPPAIPRAYGCRDCSYCPFQDSCDNMEGNTAKDRFEATKPKKKKVF